MNIFQNYINVFKRWNDFKGRTRRSDFWYFFLAHLIVIFLCGFLDGLIFGGKAAPDATTYGEDMTRYFNDMLKYSISTSWFANIYYIISFVPTIALSVRRLHDVNKSGWWNLLHIFFPIGSIVLFVFSVLDGTPGKNKWGDDPKGRNEVNLNNQVI